mmetsp:Transcript_4223/g.9591  ORF Transcript_4223/g.9591 Transcript_4223/m.9591 type:complete len:207 (+) Transcript_4223:1451-2071(+)
MAIARTSPFVEAAEKPVPWLCLERMVLAACGVIPPHMGLLGHVFWSDISLSIRIVSGSNSAMSEFSICSAIHSRFINIPVLASGHSRHPSLTTSRKVSSTLCWPPIFGIWCRLPMGVPTGASLMRRPSYPLSWQNQFPRIRRSAASMSNARDASSNSFLRVTKVRSAPVKSFTLVLTNSKCSSSSESTQGSSSEPEKELSPPSFIV